MRYHSLIIFNISLAHSKVGIDVNILKQGTTDIIIKENI